MLAVAAVVVALSMTTATLAAPSPVDNAVFTNYIIPNDVDGKPVSERPVVVVEIGDTRGERGELSKDRIEEN